jgi:glycosyltransferase involved in cell wall biosynthesis
MTRIYFVGDLRSPFIRQDLEQLTEQYEVLVFDFKGFYSSPKLSMPRFLMDSILLWERDTDVVWIWFADIPAIPFIILSKIYGVKSVVNIGGWEVYADKSIRYGNQLNPIRGAITRWIMRMADRLIVQSPAYMDIVNKLEPTTVGKTVVIPPYIDTTLCDNKTETKQDVAITAICTSAARDLKGIPTFEKASKMSRYQMCVYKNLQHDELISKLKQAKVYCQLSRTEQFNVTTAEAMACGCVPVTTKADGLQTTTGDTGIIVPFGDASAVADAVSKAMGMSGDAARERAKCYSKDAKSGRIALLLTEVIN